MALAERNEVLLGAAHIHTLPWQHSYTLSLYRIVLFCTTCVMQDVQNYTMSKNDTDLAFCLCCTSSNFDNFGRNVAESMVSVGDLFSRLI